MKPIKIEKNIQIPKSKGAGAPLKYPFNKLNIGDSFFIPFNKDSKLNLGNSLRISAILWAKRNNPKIRFTTRSSNGGIRIWRIK
jgi:hypothetical protein